MIVVSEFIFWISFSFLFYIYFLYPLLLGILFFARKKPVSFDETYEPSVSLIIAAYNEEAVIGSKIENSLKLDYPTNKLEILVFSDASSDRTDEIVKSYSDRGVKLVRVEGRRGKTFCQNEAAQTASGEILIFSDANSMYETDAPRKLVRHFVSQHVGCVVGELRYRHSKEERGRGVAGEGIYWRYEQLIKRLESHASSAVGANGSIYAIRKRLFEALPSDAVEDFVRPLKVVQKGYKVVYEPAAVTWEETASTSAKESQRRVRIVNQSVYSLIKDKSLLNLMNPLRYGLFGIQLWSHKVLRWLSGIFLLLFIGFNIPLVGHSVIYTVILAGQGIFYLLALWGLLCEGVRKRQAPRVVHFAYYFCLSCYAMLKGVFKALHGGTMSTWEPNR